MRLEQPPAVPVEVLLVEDNPGDVRLTQEALRDARVRNRLHVASDGVAAMAFLRRLPPYEDAPVPDLILLDLNLPKKSGLEVLEQVKADDRLQCIPIVILTTSQAERDVVQGYRLRANAYVTKPLDFDQFLRVVGSIERFWLEIVKLSPAEPADVGRDD
jgi:CheY-like chemotaxis protein